MKVNELFYSLQGEGHFTGTPAVFVRLSGCNLQCDFCDTRHTTGREMSEEEIVAEVSRHPARHVVVTGGEPALQLTPSFIGRLHDAGRFVQIETNGTLPLADGMERIIDWITCSPKCGMTPKIQRIDELKVVFDHTHPEYISRLEHVQTCNDGTYYLQPCDRGEKDWNKANLTACIHYIMEHPKWRLSLQTHKILDLR